MTALATPPLTPKSTATRKRLLDLAARMFIESGYAAISLRDIADEASLTKGAIYGHFRSKGQLLVEVIRSELAQRDNMLDLGEAAQHPDKLFDLFISPGSRELRLLQTDAAAAARHDPDVAAGVEEVFAERAEWILETLSGIADPDTVLFVINALSSGIGVQEAHGRDVPDVEVWRKNPVRNVRSVITPPERTEGPRRNSMTEIYKDPTASIDERVSDLIGRMTLDEKVAQLGAIWVTSLVVDEQFDPDQAAEVLSDGIGQVTRIGASTGLLADESAQLANSIQKVLVENTRLGIPGVIHEEGVGGFLHRGATTFPQGLGLAATWNTDLMAEVAGVIRTQMLAVGARHNLSPVLDVARDPRWGRVEETYGESPELCGQMGVGICEGDADRRPRQRRGLHRQALLGLRIFVGWPQPRAGPSRWPRTARGIRSALRRGYSRSWPRLDDEQLLVDRRRARCRKP